MVDKPLYEKVRKQFYKTENTMRWCFRYHDWYPEEYDMLHLLEGDMGTFIEFAHYNERFTKHLI